MKKLYLTNKSVSRHIPLIFTSKKFFGKQFDVKDILSRRRTSTI